MNYKWPILILLICITHFALAADDAHVPQDSRQMWYQVKKNDTVGDVLLRFKISPLWGAKGYVKQVVRLNPVVVQKKGNLIEPMAWIQLPIPPNTAWNLPENLKEKTVFAPSPLIVQNVKTSLGPEIPEQLSEPLSPPSGPGQYIYYWAKKNERIYDLFQTLGMKPSRQMSQAVFQAAEINKAQLDSAGLFREDSWVRIPLDGTLKLVSQEEERFPSSEVVCPPERTPQTVPSIVTEKEPTELRRFGEFLAHLGSSSTLLKAQATDGSAVILSGSGEMGVGIEWLYQKDAKYDLLANVDLNLLTVRAPSDRAVTAVSSVYKNIAFGGVYHHSPKLSAKAMLGLKDGFHLVDIASGLVDIAVGSSRYLSATGIYDFLNYEVMNVSLELGGYVVVGGAAEEVSVKNGFGAVAQIRQNFVYNAHHRYGGVLGIDLNSVNTSHAKESYTSIGAMLFWVWQP